VEETQGSEVVVVFCFLLEQLVVHRIILVLGMGGITANCDTVASLGTILNADVVLASTKRGMATTQVARSLWFFGGTRVARFVSVSGA